MAGRTFTYEVRRTSSADPATLFGLLSDGSRWSEWAKPIVPTSSLVTQGDPAPGGVGAIRKLGLGPLGLREQTVAHEQDKLHGYVLLTPSPMRDYRGDVQLSPRADGGTDITWTGSFTERLPGTGALTARLLRAMIANLAGKLARAGERL
ncbi:SRPBCC family protein [Haloechinothrix sp. YIM 98757]|uniref:SRPBCC family protein n=1 Tax=Haloechinothrix aidingensis TaxID=2752311 RepID=A0A838AEE3_9PSEU|nr:SRPBCC family protein [Haloechinothrix aidingensis]MBA0127498.1 SRPBCC family protein [Haloechinothrix aidingensis]